MIRFLGTFLLIYAGISAMSAQTPNVPADSIAADSTTIVHPRPRLEQFKENAKEVIRKLDRYDKDYIEPDHYDWTVMVQNTNFFQHITMSGWSNNSNWQTLSFYQKPSMKVGPYIGWRWIFLGYGLDVTSPAELGKSLNLNLSVYTNMIGGDIFYLRNKGNYRLGRTSGFENVRKTQYYGQNFPGLNSYTFGLYVYFILNHRRFSYPAAFNQSTRQKMSAGSWIFGFRYDHWHISFDYTQLPYPIKGYSKAFPKINESLRFTQYRYTDYSLSAGYAYNWVFARYWLMAASIAPYLGYRKEDGQAYHYNRKIKDIMHRIGIGMVGRVGVVWNNGKGFAGASFITYDNLFHRHELLIGNSTNYLNIYGGFYFRLKNKYRRANNLK